VLSNSIGSRGIGLWEAISWLGELGLSMVQIELNCKLVVEGIIDKSNSQSDFGKIMSTFRSLLHQFPNFNKGVKIIY